MRKRVGRIVFILAVSAIPFWVISVSADDAESAKKKEKSQKGSSQFGLEALPLMPKPLAASPQAAIPDEVLPGARKREEPLGILPPRGSAVTDSVEPATIPVPRASVSSEGTGGAPSRAGIDRAVEPEPQNPTLRVQGFRIEGNQLFSDEELMVYFLPLAGKEIVLKDIRDAASAVKRHYREAGYIAAYVYIPQQAVEDGIVSLEIIEGKLGEVRIHGNRYFSSQLLIRQLRLPMDRPVTYGDIQNRLLKVDEHRDIDVKATFVPGKTPGTTDLDLEVEDEFPVHGSVDANNYGTELSGEERIGLNLVHTNLFGAMDELYTRGQFSEGTNAYAVDYSRPFLHPDVRIGGSYIYGNLDLQGAFKALNVDGETQTFGIYATMPLYDTSALDANLKLGLDHKSSENSILDVTTGKDELRIANAIVTVDQKDAWGRTIWPHGLHFGLNSFGASAKNAESLTRAHTGAPFFIYRSQFQRMFYLFKEAALRLKGAWQFTPDKLPPSEQFQIGGFDTVRGYPQGEYLGDYGAVAGGEISTPLYGLSRHWRLPFQKEPLYDHLRIVTFYDYGTADLRGALPGESSKKDIAGAGVGFRLRINETLYAQVGWAFPMTETPSDGSDSVFYFGVTADLF